MRTPTYWKNKNIISSLLLPLGWLYGLATALRLALTKPQKVKAKVICIGNITAGGTGKTPVSVAIAALLKQNGLNPWFVTRGYGGTRQDVIVNPAEHAAAEVGDEPLLLAREASVVVNKQRWLGAQKAIANGDDCIIMYDGFQNPALHKDLSFIVIDGAVGFGNRCCIPSGPLREFLSAGLKRADAAIIIGQDKTNLSGLLKDLPVFHGSITPVEPLRDNLNVIAFAGIGRPQKFYRSLQELGFNLIKTVDFPDHHFYTEGELKQLISEAEEKQAVLYTTAKDYVKIPAALRNRFRVLEITITWREPELLTQFLLNA